MNKNIRFIPQLVGSLLCLVLLALLLQSLTAGVPHHYARGERLRLSGLTLRESVVVQESGGDRGPTLMHEYRIERTDRNFQSTATSGYVEWTDGMPTFKHDRDPVVRSLSERQIQGLEDMLRYFGEQEEEQSSANRTTRVRYFRGGDEIGEELFVGYSLDGNLAFRRRESRHGDYPMEEAHRFLSEAFRVPASRLSRMTAFAELLDDPKAEWRDEREAK